MVAIAATTSATPSLQATLSQSRLQQARREATQAEATAQDLRAQADIAEGDAQRSQGRMRTLENRNATTDPTYQPKRQPSLSGLRPESQTMLVDLYQLSATSSDSGVNPLPARNATPPVQNTQGQTTGRIINLRA